MTPKYITINGRRHIVVDEAQHALDKARERYSRAYNRGYLLAQAGSDEQAQRILDKANREYDAAKAEYDRARGGE